MPVVGEVKSKDLKDTEFVILGSRERAVQLALGAELVVHPVRADMVTKDSLVEVPAELVAHGAPPQMAAPDEEKELYKEHMVASREDELADLQKAKEDEGKAAAKMAKDGEPAKPAPVPVKLEKVSSK